MPITGIPPSELVKVEIAEAKSADLLIYEANQQIASPVHGDKSKST